MKMLNLFRYLSLVIILLINVQCKKEPAITGGQGTGNPPGGNINRPPVAKAGSDQLVTLPDNFALLDGGSSTDPDNNINTYSWTKIDGPSSSNISNPASIQTQVTNLIEGIYRFELKVTDVLGLLARDTIIVTVKPAVIVGLPPVANAGPDRLVTLPVNSVMLNGSASYDPDGTNIAYSWTKISGPSSYNIANANGAQTLVTDLVDGVYQFALKVTDADQSYAIDLVTVIADINDPGTFSFYNVPWSNQGCLFFINNIYSIIPPGRPFKVFLGSTEYWSGWFLIHPTFTGTQGFYYEIINGNLKINSVGIDCNFDSSTYAVRIVME